MKRIWLFLCANPRSTIAGLAAIAGALLPGHLQQIGAIAAGVGLIVAADSKDKL